MKRLVAVISACILASTLLSCAQPGSLDLTFNPGSGANATVLCMALQTNGQMVIGGYFTTFNGANRHGIVRLNADGSVDSSFDPGTFVSGGNPVNSLALQQDGKIFICNNGSFGFARLRADGSVDTSFTNLFVGGSVSAVDLQNDGKILVDGGFPNQQVATYTNTIARLNTNGTLDVTFNLINLWDSYSGLAGSADVFGLQSDGRIIVGGIFDTVNGTSCNALARLNTDGSMDTTFNPGINVGGAVTCLVVTPQDKIVIGGSFTSINGYSRNEIARLNSDGSVDTTFDPGLGAFGGYGSLYVKSIGIQSDGKVIIGGNFTGFNGTNRVNIARLNTDGSLDLTFNAVMSAGATVTCMESQLDGKTIVGGVAGTFNGVPMNGIARLNSDTSSTILNLLSPQIYFGMNLSGVVSNTYRIEYTSQLNTPSLWTPLFNVTLQTNSQFILDPTPVSGQRYYRAILLQ